MVTADAQQITELINTVNTVTIPLMIALVTGVLSVVNHFRNSKKISDLQTRVGEVGGKIEATISSNISNIGTGIDLVSKLSPEAKDAIAKTSPYVQSIAAKNAELDAKLAEALAYIKQLQGNATPSTTAREPVK